MTVGIRKLAALLAGLAALALLAHEHRAAPPASAAHTLGAFRCQFDTLDVQKGRLRASATVAGAPAAVARFDGGGNGYARGVKRVDWHSGQLVRYGVSLFLPPGFHAAVQGQVDLMRWDNFPLGGRYADWGGVAVWGSDRKARLLRFRRDGSPDVLVGPFALPEGRWFRLTVIQQLGASAGRSELYLDGRRIGRSDAPTSYDRPIQRVRFGLVAVDSTHQLRSLELQFSGAEALPQTLGRSYWRRCLTSGRRFGGW